MNIIIYSIVIIFSLALLAVAFVLISPVKAYFNLNFENRKKWEGRIVVTWLYRILKSEYIVAADKQKFTFYLFGKKFDADEEPPFSDYSLELFGEPGISSSRTTSWPGKLKIFRDRFRFFRDFLREHRKSIGKGTRNLFLLFRDLFRSFTFTLKHLDLELGLGSAATTGKLFGYYSAVKPFIHPAINFIPEFTKKFFRTSADIRVKTRPGRLLLSCLKFLLKPSIIVINFKLIRYYWKKRKSTTSST